MGNQEELTNLFSSYNALVAEEPLRVWSVIITIFGDVVLPRGGEVSSVALSAITREIGIKPEAYRVAISRLAKDGWISRRRDGRASFYRLLPSGAELFVQASKRIYAETACEITDGWQWVVYGPSDQLQLASQKAICEQAGYVQLDNRTFLGVEDLPLEASNKALLFKGAPDVVPEWVRDKCGPAALCEAYELFLSVLERLKREKGELYALSPLQACAIRVLLVHRWRRLLLRHADLPLHFFPEGWCGEECRILFHEAYQLLKEHSEAWLKEVIDSP
ncbi:PaaX family transcriptional regulator [Polycladidibacter hongkongensis]|uniref:PaaX family transcriptional regulator n=1 Tax=Polycladidibacter hongkongensis TaxID=1647556 RepID=UPI0012E35936|nr:PaaX family transcriptional regulator C-terminal domain-containing protein [Pseudovibrio hongkongensis]